APSPPQPLQGHDGVDQPHRQRLLSVVLPAEIPDFTRLLMAYNTSHIGCAPAGIEAAYTWSSLSKAGVLRGDGQVAEQMQHGTTADGVASNHRNYRLGQILDDTLQIECVQSRHTVLAHIATMATHALVASGAKGLSARTSKEHHADLWVIAAG